MQIINVIRTALLVAIIAVGVGSATVAGPLEDAFTAYQRQYATALRILQPRAEQGDADAQLKLGLMYADGDGVPENDVQAYKWWNLAAAQGHESAKHDKAIIEKTMTREQIAEAQRLSTEWKPVGEGIRAGFWARVVRAIDGLKELLKKYKGILSATDAAAPDPNDFWVDGPPNG